ncbi:hypothetical protein [Bombilactobacillus thymidiniphilus]|uniref:Uncharacterized protein n=1 Tax=Bombilactobacillus thymidiniphilus TaxID=2923363 RepID=A0ABY4PDN4_9LACO|nr:hypothetical protein [Bombilactobacillus thymidiniphilus]UQS83604.1 hypothetical protein MOO47_07525 [Bombilactobacillus thymidiniphilus]
MNTSFETNWIKENIEALDCESLQLIQGALEKIIRLVMHGGKAVRHRCRYMDNF